MVFLKYMICGAYKYVLIKIDELNLKVIYQTNLEFILNLCMFINALTVLLRLTIWIRESRGYHFLSLSAAIK